MSTPKQRQNLGIAFAAIAEAVRLTICAGSPARYGVRLPSFRGDWCWASRDGLPIDYPTFQEAEKAALLKRKLFPSIAYVAAPLESWWRFPKPASEDAGKHAKRSGNMRPASLKGKAGHDR